LGILERGGIVGCSLEASPYGPNRRLYFLNKSVYLTLCFGPHLYIERNLYFENLPSGVSQDAEELIAKIGHIKRSVKENGKIGSYSNVISDVDGKLENIEAEKLVLLYVRNLAMKRASELMDETKKTHDKKRVLHYVLDERNRDVERISTALNLHESVVRAILESLKKDLSEV